MAMIMGVYDRLISSIQLLFQGTCRKHGLPAQIRPGGRNRNGAVFALYQLPVHNQADVPLRFFFLGAWQEVFP